MSKVQSYFNKHVHQYARDPNFCYSLVSQIRSKQNNNNRIRILDVGCGDMSFIKGVLMTGIQVNLVVGIDLSFNMIKMGMNRIDGDKRVHLIASDGFKIPLRNEMKFDLIHIDCVLHHLIRNTRSRSVALAKQMIQILTERLSKNGILVVEEDYYVSYVFPTITSFLIFYGLKLLNALHLDISKITPNIQPGLEVNFFYDKDLEKLLKIYGNSPNLLQKDSWKIPRFYRIFLLKDFGRISYSITVKC
jgi:SAM-dependent methyltransferase